MWPTFFIPSVISEALNTDCWYRIIKLLDTEREYADGVTFDDEFVFEPVPNKIHRVVGLLRWWRVAVGGGAIPGVNLGFDSAPNELLGNMNRMVSSRDTDSPTSQGANSLVTWVNNSTGVHALDPGGATELIGRFQVTHIDFTFKAGASTGTAGIRWGVTNAVLGRWRLSASSWIDIKVYDP